MACSPANASGGVFGEEGGDDTVVIVFSLKAASVSEVRRGQVRSCQVLAGHVRSGPMLRFMR